MLYSRAYLFIHPTHNSVHLLNLSSQSVPSIDPLSLGSHQSVGSCRGIQHHLRNFELVDTRDHALLCDQAAVEPAPRRWGRRRPAARAWACSDELGPCPSKGSAPATAMTHARQRPDITRSCRLLRGETGLQCLLLEFTVQNPLASGREKI